MTQITFPESPSRCMKLYYDGLGRRVQIDYYKQGSPDPVLVSRQKFVYLGGSVIQELDNAQPVPNVVREYIRDGGLGGGIGSIIYCKEGTDYYYFHYNHKGDVASVRDGEKEEVAYYEYDAWGNIMTEAGTWRSPYCFSTKEQDCGIKDGDYEYQSGLLYFGARHYSPETARWTQRDPAGTVEGLNVYAFVANEPVRRIDPWGEQIVQLTSYDGGLNGAPGWAGYPSYYGMPPTTACDVWCFMAGPGGFYDLTGLGGGKTSYYWCEIWRVQGSNVGLWWGREDSGTTMEWKWRRRTYKSSDADRTLLFGDFANLTCDCAGCKEIQDCLRKANADPGNFPNYVPTRLFPLWKYRRGFNCSDYADALLESCCLDKGPIVERRDAPDVPSDVRFPYY